MPRKMPRKNGTQLCFCGSQRPFSRCCEPYIAEPEGTKQMCAPTAEALMRSRYSAFCLGNIDYLIVTHHLSMRTDDEEKSLARTIRTTQWANLVVVSKQKGRKQDKTGIVEFVAAYATKKAPLLTIQSTSQSTDSQSTDDIGTPLSQLHERSQFVREGKQWFYLSGEILPPYQPGRSQPCWCGSRKPFKRCHG